MVLGLEHEHHGIANGSLEAWGVICEGTIPTDGNGVRRLLKKSEYGATDQISELFPVPGRSRQLVHSQQRRDQPKQREQQRWRNAF